MLRMTAEAEPELAVALAVILSKGGWVWGAKELGDDERSCSLSREPGRIQHRASKASLSPSRTPTHAQDDSRSRTRACRCPCCHPEQGRVGVGGEGTRRRRTIVFSQPGTWAHPTSCVESEFEPLPHTHACSG